MPTLTEEKLLGRDYERASVGVCVYVCVCVL